MATGNSSNAAGASGTARPATGHAARTKVSMPGSTGPRSESAAPRPKRRPPAPPKPWYRKGRFWLAVIVLEAIVAFALSIIFMPKGDDVSLDGADFATFCPMIRQAGTFDGPSTANDAAGVAAMWGQRAELLRRLQAPAPEALRPDLEDLAGLAQDVQDQASEVRSRSAADPAYDGTAAIASREAQVGTRGEVAQQRLNFVALHGCGIDLTAPPTPSTTVVGPPTTGASPVSVGPTTVS